MKKKTALLFVLTPILVILIAFVLNEFFVFFTELRIGLVYPRYSREDFIEYNEWNLSNEEEVILLLCYFPKEKEFGNLCLNKERESFDKLEIDFNMRIRKNFSANNLAGTFQLVEIIPAKSLITVKSRSHKSELLSYIQALVPRDFIVSTDDELGVNYIDLYDYINVSTFLVREYSKNNMQEDIEQIVDEVKSFVEDSFKQGYVFVYPASVKDISTLEEYSTKLAGLLRQLSNARNEDMYFDFEYAISANNISEYNSINSKVLKDYSKYYKVENYIKSIEQIEDEYFEILSDYKEYIVIEANTNWEKIDIIGSYLPSLTNTQIQDYFFNLYQEDREKFISEASMLAYYLNSDKRLENKYSICNILGKTQ